MVVLSLNLQTPTLFLLLLSFYFCFFLVLWHFFSWLLCLSFGFSCLFVHESIIIRMNQEQLQQVYKMVDSVPFSRPKRNLARDFSDALMLAEVIHHYNPKMVELHNYPPANAIQTKIKNWNTLNSKVLKKIGITLTSKEIEAISNATPGIIQEVLYQLFLKFQQPEEEGSLAKNAKTLENKGLKLPHWQDQTEQVENEEKGDKKEDKPRGEKKKRIMLGEGGGQTEEILDLVAKIDQATDRLLQLQQQNKLKDEIIHNLQSKIEKLIFN